MAVEIKELVIRAVATEGPQEEQQATASPPAIDEDALVQKAVKACVKEVLEILKRKNSR